MEASGRPTGGATTPGPVSLYLERSTVRPDWDRTEAEDHTLDLEAGAESVRSVFGTPGTLDASTPRATHMPACPGLRLLRARTSRPGSPANVNHLPALSTSLLLPP